MAAPAISGLVADLLQIHPRWTPDQVKGVLTSSAVSDNPSLREPNAIKAALVLDPPEADQGLTPSSLLNPANGTVNYTWATWSFATWSRATGLLRAGYANKSYDCTTCSDKASGSVDSSFATWTTIPLG
jgi:subtilisin family serine protease